MPAPKNPNTKKATETNVRRKHDRWAAELREAGWLVIPPEDASDALRAEIQGWVRPDR